MKTTHAPEFLPMTAYRATRRKAGCYDIYDPKGNYKWTINDIDGATKFVELLNDESSLLQKDLEKVKSVAFARWIVFHAGRAAQNSGHSIESAYAEYESEYEKAPTVWVENKICPKCKSENIKWLLSSTKECNDCKHVFRAEDLIDAPNQ